MSEAKIASLAIQLDQKTITETVEKIVLQEIASKLGDPGAYFDRVVKSCVQQTVDQQGNPSRSSYDRTTLIEYTATKAINEFAKTVVHQWMDRNKVQLKKAIEDSLKKHVGTMAKIMADAACQGASWGRVHVTVTPKVSD
jgi:hypothetical protein